MKKKLNIKPQFVTLDFPNPLQSTATSGPGEWKLSKMFDSDN